MKIVSLNGTWHFRVTGAHPASVRDHAGVRKWMRAIVPGTVHTDLLSNKKIPDPFYRMNELDVQWIDKAQWIYRKEFTLPRSFLKEDAIHILAEGLDTYATLRLNGKVIAETSNMFIEHRIEVKKYLRSGRNVLEIVFDSPVKRAKALEKRHGALRVASEPHRVYVRKAQYSFSWDWGPKLTTSGIWRKISLRAYSGGMIENPFIRMISIGKREAIAGISADVRQWGKRQLTLRSVIEGSSAPVKSDMPVTGTRMNYRIRIPNPELWWPNGYGEQPMYRASFSLFDGKKEVHRVEVPFAIRRVKLLQEGDREGKSFIVEINGVKIFCKGADWIPGDNFIPRIADSKYETLLRLAKDVSMNMIRVWGGGIYEQEKFYQLCDELGLMVWQDFMYACGEYPQEPWFLKQAQEEAESAVRKLRNHPSIVVWCGNNECEWLFCTENPDKTADDMKGAAIFRDILPRVCKTYDGTRPYWRSSPFGSGFPNAESNGNHHQWVVWSYWKDYKEYENDNARFVTEFGFQAPANRTTFEDVTVLKDRHPQSPVMEHHNKQAEGTERLLRFQAAHYRLGDSFDGFIYKGQLVQAEALKCAVEHWRRRKFNTAGSLFWQLNDCWPVSSWAVIDSALRPKASYYFAKKFFAPHLVSLKRTEKGVEVWVINDKLVPINGKLEIVLKSLDGKARWKRRLRVRIPSNSSHKVYGLDSSVSSKYDPSAHYLWAQLILNGKVASENRFFFVEPKHLQLAKAKAQTRVSKTKSGMFEMEVKSKSFLKNVRLEVEGEDIVFGDNYFDVDAGTTKNVLFPSRFTLGDVRKKIRLRWL